MCSVSRRLTAAVRIVPAKEPASAWVGPQHQPAEGLSFPKSRPDTLGDLQLI